MPTLNESYVNSLKINRLTKTQLENATTLSSEQLYFEDPEFVGGKLLATDSNGNIVESSQTIPTKTSDLTNDSGFITSSALSGYATETWVGQQGYLTSTSLNGYATQQWVGQQGFITGITSSDVITALGYSPVNPTALAEVATSGSYNDLSNKPTIPTANNPTITITQGGVTKGSFTLNQSAGDTIALDAGGGSSVDIDNVSITKNGDDEIQTVGVINQNNTSTALKQWSGTKAQYDLIATKDANTVYNITDDTTPSNFANTSLSNLDATGQAILSSKVDLVSGVSQSDVDYVVASQFPTSENDYTWFRLYKSGWLEQGGFGVSVNSSTSATIVTSTINLLKQFSSTYYGVQIQGLQATTSSSSSKLYVSTKNTSSFVITIQNSILSGGKIDWEAKGMAE